MNLSNFGLSNFNFAQPLWLWGLVGILLGWIWYKLWHNKRNSDLAGLEKFADPKLIPHILISSDKQQRNTWFGWGFACMTTCIILALANPRWDYVDIDAYAPAASMVILLDLSASMNAQDITPSRVIRARQSLEDLLDMSRGLKIGLIGFAAIPHLISPITDDIQTIKAFLPALNTDLISKQGQGDSLNLALQSAAELLKSEAGVKKSILLVSDGDFTNTDYSRELKVLAAQDVTVHVMGVGTIVGAPYTDQNGALEKLQNKLIISKLNQVVLQNIAQQGHGLYVELQHSTIGIQQILDKAQNAAEPNQIASGKIRQWEDRYYVALIPAVLVFLGLISQRAFFMFSLVILLNVVTCKQVQAYDLVDAFKNSEQRGKLEYSQTNFVQAAELFTDPYRKGVALYRAGQYAAAEQFFKAEQRPKVQTAARYNAGNSQMQLEKWREAIQSYEQVLQVEPEHADAKFNLALAKKMLENDEKNKDKDDGCDDGCDQKDSKDSKDGKNDKDAADKQQDKTPPEAKEDPAPDQKPETEAKPDPKQDPKQDPKPEPAQQADMDQAPPQPVSAADDARAQQWLNRINSDIRVFLKNKFYIEDMLNVQ